MERYLMGSASTCKDFMNNQNIYDTYDLYVTSKQIEMKNIYAVEAEVKGKKNNYILVLPTFESSNGLTTEQFKAILDMYNGKCDIANKLYYQPIYKESVKSLNGFAANAFGRITKHKSFLIFPGKDFITNGIFDCDHYELFCPQNIQLKDDKEIRIFLGEAPEAFITNDYSVFDSGSSSIEKVKCDLGADIDKGIYKWTLPNAVVKLKPRHILNVFIDTVDAKEFVLHIEASDGDIHIKNLIVSDKIVIEGYKNTNFIIDNLDISKVKKPIHLDNEFGGGCVITINNIIGDASKLYITNKTNVTIPSTVNSTVNVNRFKDKNIICSGILTEYLTRKVAEQAIRNIGANVASSINKADILICDEVFNNGGLSSKLKTAQAKGIEIISSRDFAKECLAIKG